MTEQMDHIHQQVPDPAEGHERDLPDRLDERFGKAEDALGTRLRDDALQANGIDLRGKRTLRGSAEEVADLTHEALGDPTPEQSEHEEEM